MATRIVAIKAWVVHCTACGKRIYQGEPAQIDPVTGALYCADNCGQWKAKQ